MSCHNICSYLIIVDEIWDISVWDVIKRAFPEGNCYSRVIVTTQIEDVALACCEDQAEQQFLCNSESLNNISQMYNDLCPLLKTCLLYLNMYPEDYVFRKVDLVKQWVAEGFLGVGDTIRRQKSAAESQQLVSNDTVEVSAQPDESQQEVDRQVIPDKEGTAERYFDELVRKKIVQPVEVDCDGQVLACIVHHTVLDFIAQKSMEEDFINIVDYPESITVLPNRVRRLTIKFRGAKSAEVPRNLTVCSVRSLLFSGFFKCVPSLVEYWLLRVLILDIWGDQVEEVVDLGIIGELFQLRYLKIQCNITIKLPAKIRQLKYLKTLDVAARVATFPLDIYCLKNLWHLRLPCEPHLSLNQVLLLIRSIGHVNIISDAPLAHILLFGVAGLIHQIRNNIISDIAQLSHVFAFGQAGLVLRIGQMVSLRSLRNFNISTCSSYSMRELGNLTNLQDLHLTCSAAPSSLQISNIVWLISNLCKSSHLKSLIFDGEVSSNTNIISFDGSSHAPTTPPAIEKFDLSPRIFIISSLPEWVQWLSNLRTLKIAIRELSVRGVDILQELAALAALSLHVRTSPVRRIIFNNGFQALKYFKFTCTSLCVEFTGVAMRQVQTLKLSFNIDTMQQYRPEEAGIRCLAGVKVISAKIGGAGTDQASREAAKHRLLVAIIKNNTQPPIINIKIVDWIIHGDTEQSSADVITRGSSDEQHIFEETDRTEDINRTADSRITSWEPSWLIQKPGWVGQRPWNGVRLYKTVQGITYVMRQHVKQAGFRLGNEVASINQDMERLTMLTDSCPDSQPLEWVLQVQDLAYDIQDFVDIYSWLRIRSPRHALAHVSNIVQLKERVRTIREWQHCGISSRGAASSVLPPSTSSPHTPNDRLVGIEEPMIELLELVLLPGEIEKAAEQLRISSVKVKSKVVEPPSASHADEQKRNLSSDKRPIVSDELQPWPTMEGVPGLADEQRLRVISIVGYRGIGKTALARAVYDVARNPQYSSIWGPCPFLRVDWVVASECRHSGDLLDKIWPYQNIERNERLVIPTRTKGGLLVLNHVENPLVRVGVDNTNWD
ncbi:hypothetical protein HU200_065909 [Digitaria exilis]|uniref:NB-ARC domain-containing protein n=1 Tax=Digitaria exilis TaxID=1010633 RepID=A0A834ZXW6_9POAL|nr:hypothetical protein HU200_065909 [Digitaria exilis]